MAKHWEHSHIVIVGWLKHDPIDVHMYNVTPGKRDAMQSAAQDMECTTMRNIVRAFCALLQLPTLEHV